MFIIGACSLIMARPTSEEWLADCISVVVLQKYWVSYVGLTNEMTRAGKPSEPE